MRLLILFIAFPFMVIGFLYQWFKAGFIGGQEFFNSIWECFE